MSALCTMCTIWSSKAPNLRVWDDPSANVKNHDVYTLFVSFHYYSYALFLYHPARRTLRSLGVPVHWTIEIHTSYVTDNYVQYCNQFHELITCTDWPRWLWRCFLRWSDWANLLPQISQANGRSPVCPRMCFLRLPASVNARKQTMHEYLRSPVWIIMWRRIEAFRLNVFGHTLHLYGRSPVWLRRWSRIWSSRGKCRPQSSQVNGRSPAAQSAFQHQGTHPNPVGYTHPLDIPKLNPILVSFSTNNKMFYYDKGFKTLNLWICKFGASYCTRQLDR